MLPPLPTSTRFWCHLMGKQSSRRDPSEGLLGKKKYQASGQSNVTGY
jgi:hypothetical protein